jgi:hypothetical protein
MAVHSSGHKMTLVTAVAQSGRDGLSGVWFDHRCGLRHGVLKAPHLSPPTVWHGIVMVALFGGCRHSGFGAGCRVHIIKERHRVHVLLWRMGLSID